MISNVVAETIRKEDGEIIKMARRPGAYNELFFNINYLTDKKDNAIEKHVFKFMEMSIDYKKGEPYKYPMSPVYGWCNELAPFSKGLVVIDFHKNMIHSLQNVDHPGFQSINVLNKPLENKELEKSVQFLVSNNLLNVYNNEGIVIGDFYSIYGKITLDDFRKKISSKLMLHKYIISPKDFDLTVIHYETEPDGIIQMIKNLKNDGFSFSDKEYLAWKDFFEDSLEENFSKYDNINNIMKSFESCFN